MVAARSHAGGARPTTLAGTITSGATSFTVTAGGGAGFPDGGGGNFVVCLDPGLAGEEKILCSARSGDTFTVATSGRGYDDTVASAHANLAAVTHTFTAIEATEANAHIIATTGVHGIPDTSALLTAAAAAAAYLTPAAAAAAYQPKVTGSPATASVATTQATTSATLTDLTTVGPAVTITTGSSVLVLFSAYAQNNVGTSGNRCAVAVSGATTRAASLSEELYSSGSGSRGSQHLLLTGLTPGSNTFTMKYAANGDSASFSSRTITVIPL